jgi:outer membrane protein TolC
VGLLGRSIWALAPLLLVMASRAAWAQCPPRCDLDALRRRALLDAPEIDGAEARVQFEEARREEAHFAPLSLGRADLSARPTPGRLGEVAHAERGDAPFGPDTGLWVSLGVEAALALTPWWLIVEMWHVTEGTVDMREHELALARDGIAIAVDRAYRDAQVAAASLEALRQTTRIVDEALAQVMRAIDEDREGAGEIDRLRLVVVRAELDARRANVDRDGRRALARLRRLAGLPPGAPVSLDPLPDSASDLAPLDWHLETARRLRHEVGLSLAGVRTAQSMVRARRAETVPEIALGVFYRFRQAPVVDDQTSPWVDDPWNGTGFGYGLVYRWTPSPGERAALVRQARGDLDYARAMRALALAGIAYEVESAYADVVEDLSVLRARERARGIVARRYEELLARHAAGGARPGELSDAARDLADLELACIQATGRLLVSRSRLALATGALAPSAP